MMWLFAVVVVLLMGGVAIVAAGRTGALPEEYADRPDVTLPEARITGQDLRRVRLPLAMRGYRMAEVDALLARLADELETTALDRRQPADDDASPGPAVGDRPVQ